MKKNYSPIFTFGLFLSISITPCLGQWNSNTSLNTSVCTATDKQVDPRATDDGHGGIFIAWKDYRNGGIPDIYIQHMDSNGVAQWAGDGVALCNNFADQSTPAIVSDMAGGVIVAWSDWRSGVERDIYAQRINAAGIVQWTTDGAVVTNKPEREHNEKIISDDANGAIVVWEQQNNSTFLWEIWAQHINSNGVVQWPAGGIQMAQIANNLLNPKVQKDGRGGGFITWQDFRNNLDYDIYAQHVGANGSLLWGTTGIPVCNAANTQINPKIDPDSISGGVFISWTDLRNTIDYDIYCQLVDSMGNMLWTNNGVVVCNATGNQTAIDLLATPNIGGLIMTWKDDRAGNNDIYAQKINRLGVSQWIANGVALSTTPLPQLNPNITGDGNGGAIICWQDSTATSEWNIMAQKVDNNGIIQWPVNGAVVSNAIASQTGPKNVSDNNGGSIFVWEDYRTGTRDIYCHHLYFDGGSIGINEPSNLVKLNVFPNPFIDLVNVNYSLTTSDHISITLMNLLGESVPLETIGSSKSVAGTNAIQLNTISLKPGVYMLVLRGENFSNTIKMVKN